MSVKEIFVDAKLVDGTVVKVEGDSLMEGAKVVVVTADAEIPAPDGVHELEDGTKIETKDGVIARVEEAVAAGMIDNPAKMDEVPVEVAPEIAPMAEPVIAAIVEAITPILEEVKALTNEMKQMKAEFAAFKKEPAAKKISNGKTDFVKQNNNDLVDARVASIFSQKNK